MNSKLNTVLAALVFALSGPTTDAAAPRPAETENVYAVATLGVLGDLAREVGGDLVEVEVLANPAQDPHYVEPRPTLMQKTRKADVFIEVGLQLELWADKVVAGSGNARIQTGQPGRVVASQGISTLELPQQLSREWGDVHPFGNPHVWLDPLNAADMAANVAAGLARVDPAHEDAYAARLADFQRRIDVALFGEALVAEVGGKMLARQARRGRLGFPRPIRSYWAGSWRW
jgi:zinc/manganese transport system substrate-binding protein